MKMKLLIFPFKDGCGAEFSYSVYGTLHQSCWVSQKPRSHYPEPGLDAVPLTQFFNFTHVCAHLPSPSYHSSYLDYCNGPSEVSIVYSCLPWQPELAKHESITTLPYLKYFNGFLFYLR